MIFSILMLLLVLGVAYFHYAQGMFSSFLSAIIAAVAAAIALGCHEQLSSALLAGKYADQGSAITLCVLFGGIYIILRAAFDAMIPGYVNFGVWPDRIGGGVLGLFVGMLTAGIVAIAAQAMPFSPSILGYSRWDTKTEQITVGTVPEWARVGRQDITSNLYIHDALVKRRLEGNASGMILPADDFTEKFVSILSNGAFKGDQTWNDVHPTSYINELFGQRLGLQPGAKHTAFEINQQPQVTLHAMFLGKKNGYEVVDGDFREFRPPGDEVPSNIAAGPGQAILIVRLTFAHNATDEDNYVRFSLSAIRLVAGPEGHRKDYNPIAILGDGPVAISHRADDFLVVDSDKGIDAVFLVDTGSDFNAFAGAPDAADAKLAPGSFIEFKRLSRVPASEMAVKPADAWSMDPNTINAVLHKQGWTLERTPAKK